MALGALDGTRRRVLSARNFLRMSTPAKGTSLGTRAALLPCMWKGALIPLAGVCILVGCNPAPGHDYALVIDSAVSAEEASSITNAVFQWAAILDGRLKMTVAIGPCRGVDREVCVHLATEAQIVALGGLPSALGRTIRSDMSDRADIYLRDTAGTRAIAHEVGHAMGLEHTQTGTLMCTDQGCAAWVPTCDDVAQWGAVRNSFRADTSCPKGGSFEYTGL